MGPRDDLRITPVIHIWTPTGCGVSLLSYCNLTKIGNFYKDVESNARERANVCNLLTQPLGYNGL